MSRTALIVGTGSGISASVARALAGEGYKLALAARRPEKLETLAHETGAKVFAADAVEPDQVTALFSQVDRDFGHIDVVLYNASFRTRGPFLDLNPPDVQRTLMVCAHGGFLVGQEAAKRMVARGSGTILFTGASASVKGYAQSAPFAMGKFALRGLAQSMARELGPKGVHVAHIVIDGSVRGTPSGREAADAVADNLLEPDAIAATYLNLIGQHRSAWSLEVELRPWVERF